MFQEFFKESFSDFEHCNFVVLDAILLFFSDLNSSFLLETIWFFFVDLLGNSKSQERMDVLLSFNGLKVCLKALFAENFAKHGQTERAAKL